MSIRLTNPPFSRRDFLKLGGLSASSLALMALLPGYKPLPSTELNSSGMRGRVTTTEIYLYSEPNFKSKRLARLRRDQIIDLEEALVSPDGPPGNPRWYRTGRGFLHSAYVQRVERAHLNEPLAVLPEGGQLGEISLPIVQSMRRGHSGRWSPLYCLYFESVFWITSLDEGPDRRPWYGLTDDRLRVVYHVPAEAVRPVLAEEISPLSADVPDDEKRLEVSIYEQTVTAFEAERPIFQADVSSGAVAETIDENGTPAGTPLGKFRINVKRPSRHMGDGRLTTDPEAYELPGVPWVSYFHTAGIAFHGTYWHDNFGARFSHGCINMRNPDALWLYRWSNPRASGSDWHLAAQGTQVKIIGPTKNS